MKKRYPLEISDKISGIVYYPAELNSDENIHTVSFGSCSMSVKCIVHPKGENRLVLSKDVSERLHLTNFETSLHIFLHDGTLNIGPLVGIITSGFTPILIRPVGERSYFFAKLLSVQKSVGTLPFIFGEQHIDWENGLVTGYFYHEDKWKIKKVPFPHVIYDRLPNRKAEKRLQLIKLKEKLQKEYLIPWFNPGFFNKLDVYEKLLNEPEVEHYLPDTEPFTSFSIIERMLADYGDVYIKPVNGSLGFGIYQIIYDKQNKIYYCRYQDEEKKTNLRKFQSVETLVEHVFSNKSLEKLIIQQGIRLLRIDKRKVDFRVHTNKDATGNWVVSAIAVKVASPRSATTHIKNGGTIKTLSEAFPDIETRKIYEEKLKTAALSLSKSLEDQIPGIIGEIGFDLGIDIKGNVWLFEANSKPGRSIFVHPNLTDFDLLTRKLTLAFSIFLTERVIMQPEEIFQ